MPRIGAGSQGQGTCPTGVGTAVGAAVGSPKCKKRGALEATVTRLSTALSIASLAFGVLFYLASVGGLLWGKATPPLDHGVVPVTAVFVLFGLVGLLLGRGKPVDAKQY